MRKPFLFTLASIISVVSFILSSFIPGAVQPVFACYTWSVGARVGLKGGTQIRSGSGLSYPVHTTLPADANNWTVDIINGPRTADGLEWWDISRQNIDGGGTGWVYKSQAGWDLCGSVTPGNVYVASGLELVPDPNHSWPPYEGDKLIGRFTLGNSGGSSVRITGYGVRLRRNTTDYWDFLNTNAFDLQAGQTVRFDQNNERALTSGHYRAEITWQVNGGAWQVSNGTEFDVYARPGSIYVSSGLELITDPNHAWPPYTGDKLIGRFGLGNNGGAAVRITGYGVRLRRNTTDYWDFLNTNAFDLQPGQTANFNQNNERGLDVGHYRAEITWQVNGGTWQVANAIEFDVATRPSNVYVSSGLELFSDPNHAWPPVENDKLIARFTLANNGGQSMHLEGFGVRMRRNSTDYWDFLNMAGTDLGPGSSVQFYQNNERQLLPGHYRAEITWKASGQDWVAANATEFDVQAPVTGSSDGASFIGQSNYPTVPAGKPFQIWFEVQNSGNTIWSDAAGYRLGNISGPALGASSPLSLNVPVKPGETFRWNISMQAPASTGVYRTWWRMTHNGAQFGPSMYIDVTVSDGAAATIFDLRVTAPLNIPAANLEVNHSTSATFTVRNYGTTTASLSGLAAGGRGPGGDYDIQDFPWMNGITIAPGQSYTYNASRSFTADGRYRFFPVARTWDGQYVTLNGPNGESITDTLRVSALPLVFAKSISVLYQGSADEAVDVITYFPRPQADGSYIVNIRIVNKTKLALAVYFHDLGSPTTDPHGDLDVPYDIIMPTSDEENGGKILRDVTFKPDSDLNMVFSAYGTETQMGGDGTKIWMLNFLTLFCMYQFGDVCPSTAMDLGSTVSQEVLSKMGPNLATAGASYGITESLIKQDDAFKLLGGFKSLFEAHPEWIVWMASKMGRQGVTTEVVKNFLGGWGVKFFLAYPRFWAFSKDLGRSRWLGVFEVRLLPTLKLNPYLFPGELMTAAEAPGPAPAQQEGMPSLPRKQSEGPDFAQIRAGLDGEPIELTTIRASSSAFGPGWEYFRMNDGDYASGWTNGGDLSINSEWVTFEIGDGRPVQLQEVLIHPGPSGSDDPSLALKDFDVEYSYDGWHYTWLFSGSFSPAEVGSAKVFQVDPVLAHQIRLRVYSNQGGSSTSKFSLAEIAVAGSYATQEEALEPDDTVEDARLLPIGQSAARVINHADDWDCHSVELLAGVNYTLLTHNLAQVTDTVMNLYGLDGRYITGDDDSGGGRASRIWYTPNTSGLYVLCVYEYGQRNSGPAYTYQVRVDQNPSDDWYGEYYNNDHFEGSPAMTRRDSAINFDWYEGSPDPALSTDYFSIRWSRVASLEAGEYTFHISRDDGMQVWIDGELVYSGWDVAREDGEVSLHLGTGNHLIQIDSYENDGWAQAKFSWDFAPEYELYLPLVRK